MSWEAQGSPENLGPPAALQQRLHYPSVQLRLVSRKPIKFKQTLNHEIGWPPTAPAHRLGSPSIRLPNLLQLLSNHIKRATHQTAATWCHFPERSWAEERRRQQWHVWRCQQVTGAAAAAHSTENHPAWVNRHSHQSKTTWRLDQGFTFHFDWKVKTWRKLQFH